MRHVPERSVALPGVTVELATITWDQPGESPRRETHALFQRLSRDHSPLRLGHRAAFDMLPRVRSVGFIPAGESVPLFPIEKPLRVLTCFFDPAFVEAQTGVATEVWSRNARGLAVLRNKRVEILMQDLQAELVEPGLAQAFLVESLAGVMLVELARHVCHIDRRRTRSGVVLALAPWQLRRIEERILAAPEGGYPSLGELADLCGVSQGHLARAFKVTTGWQIQKYIAELRIASALELLRGGAMTCEEVSARLGFSSPGYFSTVFRRMTGLSPSEVRRQALGALRQG
ncbi:MAG TPA: AraC family transcriptional regulator [Novosphingobium sp.]|nr:AraC family transcriptional regulator [Novosphingobium sp.]